ncbi:MAG TPA: hypothetical protein VE999_13435 [Gemmataceae bacterium]|nr:hypothetical protein [Gemmataceae bacterium]
MKRLLVGAVVALGLASTATPAWADCYFDYSCCRHFCWVHTAKNRCFTFSSHSNPLPCAPCAGGYGGPALWNSLAAYGPHGYAVAAQPAAAAAPAAAAPAAPAPSFKAPQPAPATNGVKQAVYYYGQPTNPGYGYNAGFNYYGTSTGYSYYGYGADYSYAQAPNYWY